ncbi:hypothetical protein AAVH_15959 [Aphelenchoides avenae]|nr:hypothetical protein AAVH_15959 [Aphelenchus avenae]
MGLGHRMTCWRFYVAMLMATVLDPRFKLELFDNAVQEEVKEKLKQYAEQEAAKNMRASTPDTTDSEDNNAPVDVP